MNSLLEVQEYLQKNQVKYAHVLTVNGLFSDNLIRYFQENPKLFVESENIIIVDGYAKDGINQYNNVFFIPSLQKHILQVLNDIVDNVSHIILHYLPFELSICIPLNVAKKTIWRTWGNDLTYSMSYVPGIRLKLKMLYKSIGWITKSKKNVRHFEAIGMSATGCDKIVLRRQKINVPTITLPYPTKFWAENISDIVKTPSSKIEKDKDDIWIMIGHSANSSLKHIRYLKKLYCLHDQNIKILMPMVYGREGYRQKVMSVAKKMYGDNAIIWTENLSYDEYLRLLNLVDIGIFEAKHQMAMGNISDLLLLNKVVLLNKRGIAYRTLIENGVQIGSTDLIKNISMDEIASIIRTHNPDTAREYFFSLRKKDAIDVAWKKMMSQYK